MNKNFTNKTNQKSSPFGRIRGGLILFLLSTLLSVTAQSTLKERLEQHVFTLASDSLQGRQAGTLHARMAAEYIVKQWEEIEIEPYTENSFWQIFNNGKFQNLVGIIRGNDPNLQNEYIVVGAHYDHIGVWNGNIYNGADDNASGVAVLIELARKLKYNQANLKRSIILIAFDAEEIGLLGSKHFVNNPIVPLESIKLMIGIDMVGWYQASGRLMYMECGTIEDAEKLILNEQLIPEGLNVIAKKFAPSSNNINFFATKDVLESIFITITDTYPFVLKGIPALAVSTGLVSPFHEPEDEAHLIDYDGMVLITKHLKNIIKSQCNIVRTSEQSH